MNNIRRNLDGPYARGVVNPYTAHVHPYPTRFHGAIYTRPVFGLPYVRSPHAVFKPDDFYSYYGVKGLGGVGGTFHGSSMGNGTIGGNTLGLGATGSPIYYRAGSSNPKVTALQSGLNKVLISQGFRQISVTGILEDETCGALGLMGGLYPQELRSQVDDEILEEAARICRIAQQNDTVKRRMIAIAQEIKDTQDKTPAKILEPQTEVVPASTAPTVTTVKTTQEATPVPVAKPVPVLIEDPPPPTPMTIPMEVTARPADKSYGKVGVLAAVAVVAGGAYYFMRKR